MSFFDDVDEPEPSPEPAARAPPCWRAPAARLVGASTRRVWAPPAGQPSAPAGRADAAPDRRSGSRRDHHRHRAAGPRLPIQRGQDLARELQRRRQPADHGLRHQRRAGLLGPRERRAELERDPGTVQQARQRCRQRAYSAAAHGEPQCPRCDGRRPVESGDGHAAAIAGDLADRRQHPESRRRAHQQGRRLRHLGRHLTALQLRRDLQDDGHNRHRQGAQRRGPSRSEPRAGDQQINPGQIVPDLGWLQFTFIAAKTGARALHHGRPTPTTSAPARTATS